MQMIFITTSIDISWTNLWWSRFKTKANKTLIIITLMHERVRQPSRIQALVFLILDEAIERWQMWAVKQFHWFYSIFFLMMNIKRDVVWREFCVKAFS